MQNKIRVFIADDHAMLRQGLRSILSAHRNIEFVGEAENGRAALQKLEKISCDVLLLDISMPEKSGIDVLGVVRKRYPNIAVLILSTHPEEFFAVQSLRLGASGYLTKENATNSLVKAINRVARGGKYVSESLSMTLANVIGEPYGGKMPHERLSQRELQVLMGIVAGQTLSKIADNIQRSVKTVSTYRTRLLEKMRLHNNAELVTYAITHQLKDSGTPNEEKNRIFKEPDGGK